MTHTAIHNDPVPRPAITSRPGVSPASRSPDTLFWDENEGVAVRVDDR